MIVATQGEISPNFEGPLGISLLSKVEALFCFWQGGIDPPKGAFEQAAKIALAVKSILF